MNSIDFPIIGEPVTFSLSVQPAMNYPLDLYLLMDLSISMRNVLSNVQALASDIGKYFICMVICSARKCTMAYVEPMVRPVRLWLVSRSQT